MDLYRFSKKMPVFSVPPVKPEAVTGEKSAHEGRNHLRTAENQKMHVIIRKRPGEHAGLGLFGQITETAEEILSIVVVAEYRYPFDPADHDVVQGSWCF